MSMQKYCPSGYTAAYENVDDIVVSPSRLTFPKEMKDSNIPKLLESLMVEQSHTSWKPLLNAKVLQYWKKSLQQRDPSVLAEICKLIIEDSVPGFIKLYMENMVIQELPDCAYIKFTLKGLNHSDSVTTENYLRIDSQDQSIQLITSSSVKAKVTKSLNDQYLSSLGPAQLESLFTVSHREKDGACGVVRGQQDTLTIIVPSWRIDARKESGLVEMSDIFTVPRLRIVENKIIYSLVVFGTGTDNTTHALCSELTDKVFGVKFVKGKWVPTSAEGYTEDMTAEEAINNFLHFTDGGNGNILLNKMYEVAIPARGGLVCLRKKLNTSQNEHCILKVSESNITLLGVIDNDGYWPRQLTSGTEDPESQRYIDECKLVIALQK